jgi:malate dehydrogenase (oxaloacetate-decarboxylating)
MDIYKDAVELHEKLKGKIRVQNKIDVRDSRDLSLVYSPGVAEPCDEIARNPERVYDLTLKGNSVAIVTDGSAVLGLGNIGAKASIPVMEGKAMLFRKFAQIDAFPTCLDTQDTEEIIRTCQLIAPVFGGINLEDISAPRSFEIEERLQNLGIPVFHDDQHGTAVVVLAGLVNACKLTGKSIESLKVVINGSGAAGVAIAKLLRCVGPSFNSMCQPVSDIIMCDSRGIIHRDREDLNESKRLLLSFTNRDHRKGFLKDALEGADVFIGVSVGDILEARDIQKMNSDAMVFALANPTPEISPEKAKKGGAIIYATGRSDLPNQINNVLGFPGIFRGALDARADRISGKMKLAAAYAIAKCVDKPRLDYIIASSLNEVVAWNVADAVRKTALGENE